MLIIESYVIQLYQARSFYVMFAIINIIIIIVSKFHARAWPWLHDSMIYRLPQISICLKSEWRPIFSCARSFFTLRVQVVLRRSFGDFYSAAVFLFPPEKLSENHPLWEALATWSNKYNWFKWVMSSDKNKPIGLESHLLVQITVPF